MQDIAEERGQNVLTHLYGQEINSETYAICKADLLLKGEENADANIVGGPEYSTLSNDVFRDRQFDFMLSNPPYGKGWKSDQDKMGGKKTIDPRFVIQHAGDPEYSMVTRVSDGQLMFLANLVSKMKEDTPLGSRIAEVHNGSSLFTGDAGQGESNIRRWIIENDWLEAIVALPLNMFYNTGIATYVWILTNKKPEHRKGKVQLINATEWYSAAAPQPGAKDTRAFRRRHPENLRHLLGLRGNRRIQDIPQRGLRVLESHGGAAAQTSRDRPRAVYKAAEIKKLKRREGKRRAPAAPIIRYRRMAGRGPSRPLSRQIPSDHERASQRSLEYEPDTDLRDTEQIPLLAPRRGD